MNFQIISKDRFGSSFCYFIAEESEMHKIACETINKEVIEDMKEDEIKKRSPFYTPLCLPKTVNVVQYSTVFNRKERNGIKFKLRLTRSNFNGISGKFYHFLDKA